MLKEKCATALSTATCLRQEKTRITPQSPVTFYTRVRRVGEPNQAPSAPERPASTCFECAAATQQSSCWVLWEPPFPLLNIWARERVHTCSTQPGGNKPWTLGCSPIKVMGTPCFQAAFGGVCCSELVQMLTRSLLCAPGNAEEQLRPRNALRLPGTHPSLDSGRGEIAVQQHQHSPSLLHLLWAKGEWRSAGAWCPHSGSISWLPSPSIKWWLCAWDMCEHGTQWLWEDLQATVTAVGQLDWGKKGNDSVPKNKYAVVPFMFLSHDTLQVQCFNWLHSADTVLGTTVLCHVLP